MRGAGLDRTPVKLRQNGQLLTVILPISDRTKSMQTKPKSGLFRENAILMGVCSDRGPSR